MNTAIFFRYRGHLLLCFLFLLVLGLNGCASEQFQATTDLENFQKLQQKRTLESKPRKAQMVTPATANADNLGDYLLGAGDLITVSVFETAALNAEVRVSSRGFVSLPLLGAVEVANSTAAETEKKIEQLYAEKYIRDPHVTVYIKEHVSKQITLVGALVKPGTYDYVSRRRLLDVIAIANGLGDKSGSLAYVTRNDALTNKRITYLVDLDQLIKYGNMEQNLVIQGGDVIFVPEAGQCFIDGAVRKPGTYAIKSKMTVAEGVTLAGGLASYADPSSIKLIRFMGKGKKREIIKLSYNDLQSAKGDAILLEDQDIIFAESSSSSVFSSGTGFTLGFMGTGINYKDPTK